jgi:hypothetical protein
VADPATRTVEVFEDGRDGDVLSGGDVLTSQELPGLTIALNDLFETLA